MITDEEKDGYCWNSFVNWCADKHFTTEQLICQGAFYWHCWKKAIDTVLEEKNLR